MQWGPTEFLAVVALAAALILGAPPFVQMFWGRPKISFLFTRQENKEATILLVHICNYPVGNRLLSGIGVRREDAHFHVRLTVKDSAGNQILNYMEPPPGSGDPYEQNLFHLHSGPAPKSLEIVGGSEHSSRIYYEERANGYKELSAGTYSIRLNVWVGEKIFSEDREFVVTANPRNSYWVN